MAVRLDIPSGMSRPSTRPETMPASSSGSCHTATFAVVSPFTYCHRLVTWRNDTAVPKL